MQPDDPHVKKMMKSLTFIVEKLTDFFVEKNGRFRDKEEMSENIYKIATERSEAMNEFAKKHHGLFKGVWKIGDKHVEDIQKIEKNYKNYKRPFNLISEKRFNTIFGSWLKKKHMG